MIKGERGGGWKEERMGKEGDQGREGREGGGRW